jgi:hypothetical protein
MECTCCSLFARVYCIFMCVQYGLTTCLCVVCVCIVSPRDPLGLGFLIVDETQETPDTVTSSDSREECSPRSLIRIAAIGGSASQLLATRLQSTI